MILQQRPEQCQSIIEFCAKNIEFSKKSSILSLTSNELYVLSIRSRSSSISYKNIQYWKLWSRRVLLRRTIPSDNFQLFLPIELVGGEHIHCVALASETCEERTEKKPGPLDEIGRNIISEIFTDSPVITPNWQRENQYHFVQSIRMWRLIAHTINWRRRKVATAFIYLWLRRLQLHWRILQNKNIVLI